MPNQPILIFGCGGHSRSVADILLSCHPDVKLVFIDPNAESREKLFGFEVLPELPYAPSSYFFALGDNLERKKKYEEIGPSGLISIISSKSHIGHLAKLGQGVFMGNFCHLGPETVIGNNTILNNGCIVEHEVHVGSHSHVGPRAVISGRCKIGDCVFIGVGTTVKDNITICSNVIVGAGTVIVKDITEPGIYIGCPGRKVKDSCLTSFDPITVL
jgi:UDP-N-acetylbacillosamine N-acetyltransferase